MGPKSKLLCLGTINRMGQESEKHIESLDGLRGIAILLVFLFHYLTRNPYNPLSWFASLGWSGVDSPRCR
jgi:peptidoglycan/LPS O-acetylase OafA/YrhL